MYGKKKAPSGQRGYQDGWTNMGFHVGSVHGGKLSRRVAAGNLGFFLRVGDVVLCEAVGKGVCPFERRERRLAERERLVAERERVVGERERRMASMEGPR